VQIECLFQASVETDELAPPAQIDAGPEVILRADSSDTSGSIGPRHLRVAGGALRAVVGLIERICGDDSTEIIGGLLRVETEPAPTGEMRLSAGIFIAESRIAADAIARGVLGNNEGGVLDVLIGVNRSRLFGVEAAVRQ